MSAPQSLLQARVTHGRHCPCRACGQEDWSTITSPCGMHGEGCPAIYAPITDDPETWPCGCTKGMAPHGSGWSDCAFSDEQKAVWRRAAGVPDRWRCPECGDVYGRHVAGCVLV